MDASGCTYAKSTDKISLDAGSIVAMRGHIGTDIRQYGTLRPSHTRRTSKACGVGVGLRLERGGVFAAQPTGTDPRNTF